MSAKDFFLRRYRWLTHLLFIFACLIFPLLVAALVAEGRMALYLLQTGESRAAQSENFGLAFEAFQMAAISIMIASPVMPVIWWLTMRKSKEEYRGQVLPFA